MAKAAVSPPPQISGFGYVRPLGSGGFAHVYLYEQDMPRRVVAIKVLEEDLQAPAERSAFEAEADAMARLSSHPSIVSIFQASVATDGRPYIAMEYCPDSMRTRTKGKPARLAEVLDVGVRLAGALETAHQAGVLHRDIKPSNVLISTTGRPALADFGIATMRGDTGTRHAFSLPWAAPEVLEGTEGGTVASEIWSLGATLYTFAAGHAPFELPERSMNTQSKMSSRIKKAIYTPIPGAQGYEHFDAVLAHSMGKAPEQRFDSMRAFGEALQRLQRMYGLDVTPLDTVASAWVTPPAPAGAVRGPVVSAVRPEGGRAKRRARLAAASSVEDRDGVLIDPPRSALRAGLIGAGIAVGAMGVIVFGIMAMGGF
ncbi:serine/threonine-protein kinase [Leucobacter sp. GX24907]